MSSARLRSIPRFSPVSPDVFSITACSYYSALLARVARTETHSSITLLTRTASRALVTAYNETKGGILWNTDCGMRKVVKG